MRSWTKIALFSFIFLIQIANAGAQMTNTQQFIFEENSIAQLELSDCSYAEWLFYLEQPIEKESETNIQNLIEKQNKSNFELFSQLSKFEIYEKESEGPNSQVETIKSVYKENKIKLIGPAKQPCPANFTIILPEAGHYYIPIKLYFGTEYEIRYFGLDVQPKAQSALLNQESFKNKTESQIKSQSQNLSNLLLAASSLLILLGAGLLVFYKKLK